MKLSVLFIVLGLLFIYIFYYQRHPLASKVRINNHTINVDVAVTPFELARGLGGRASMARDHGMLFVYDHKEQYNFWMLGMKFPLDFIWISDKTVVDITRNVLPPQGMAKPAVIKPAVEVDKILEVNAGVVDELGIKVGNTVTFIDR
jgi:uncharacterized membrane protein (UPF0127 family)